MIGEEYLTNAHWYGSDIYQLIGEVNQIMKIRIQIVKHQLTNVVYDVDCQERSAFLCESPLYCSMFIIYTYHSEH